MKLEEIQKLIKSLDSSGLDELSIRTDEGIIIKLKRHSKSPSPVFSMPPQHFPMPAPIQSQPAPAAQSEEAKQSGAPAQSKNYKEVRSPMVGTFYRSPSPDSPPYIKVGDKITKGKNLCIIEAMKLMNEIESEIEGTVVQILVENGMPVEYNQVLFLVE